MDSKIKLDLEKRIIYIHSDIDEDSMRECCYGLLEILNNDKSKEENEKNFEREPIKIFINSNGGKLDDCYSLINIMINSKTPIYTYLTGYAYSAGFFIFIAGHKRFITKFSKVMLHSFFSGLQSHSQNIIEYSDYCKKELEMLKEYILSRTTIKEETLEDIQLHKKDLYLFPKEMIELGIADEIIKEF